MSEIMIIMQSSMHVPVDVDLAGSNPVEHARAAMIGQCCEDAMKPLFVLRGETNDAKKVRPSPLPIITFLCPLPHSVYIILKLRVHP
jgi:hypothetical protein